METNCDALVFCLFLLFLKYILCYGLFFHKCYFCLRPFKRQRKEKDIKPTHHSCLFIASIPPFNHKHKYSIIYKWIFPVVLIFTHTCTNSLPTFPPPIRPFWLPNQFFHIDCNSFMIYRIEFEHSHRRRGPNEINRLSGHCHPTIDYFASENKKKCFWGD